jgi:hypothetical protein
MEGGSYEMNMLSESFPLITFEPTGRFLLNSAGRSPVEDYLESILLMAQRKPLEDGGRSDF